MSCKAESWWLLGIPMAAYPNIGIPLLVVISLASLVVTFFVCWLSNGGYAWGRVRAKTNSLQGPRGLPLFGILPVLSDSLAHVKLANIATQRRAARLMSFSLGTTRGILTCNPDVAKEILNDSAFADRPIKESAHMLMFDRAIGFAPYGDHWRRLRRISATHLFSPKRIAAFEGHRQAIADRMIADIGSAMASHGHVEVRGIFREASLQNVMAMVFGKTYDVEDDEWKELSEMVSEGYNVLGRVNWGDHLPILRFLDLQGVRRRCSKLLPRVKTFVKKIIDEHRCKHETTCKRDTEGDFVDVLLELQGEHELCEDDMIAVLWEMIFRGSDTVAIVMEWTLAMVVMHRQTQASAHKEIDEIVKDRCPTDYDVLKMEYLQGVVKETMRVHPPGPLLSWARLSTRDVHVDGHVVPDSTMAMVNMWAIMHDEGVWKNAEEFMPERFVKKMEGEDVSVMGSDLRIAPFGAGRRVCPGKALGMSTINLWVARLLRSFSWGPHCVVDTSEVLRLSCEMRTPLSAIAMSRRPFV